MEDECKKIEVTEIFFEWMERVFFFMERLSAVLGRCLNRRMGGGDVDGSNTENIEDEKKQAFVTRETFFLSVRRRLFLFRDINRKARRGLKIRNCECQG